MITVEMDGVKLASGCADPAADAFIFVHDRGAALETSSGFDSDLFLGECSMDVLKGLLLARFLGSWRPAVS